MAESKTKKKEDKKEEKKEKKVKKEKTVKNFSVLIKPRITEKAVLLSDARGVYVFNVEKEATKKSVAAAIKTQYKVTPSKVRMLRVRGKVKRTGNILGARSTGKKAYVYLKKGDKIDVA